MSSLGSVNDCPPDQWSARADTNVPGERLPAEVLVAAQAALSDIMISPADIADALMHAVTRPAHVHIPEIVIRSNKNFDL